MAVTIEQDYSCTFREDVPLPVKMLIQREGSVSGSTKAMQNVVQTDFSSPGSITVRAYLDDGSETPVAALVTLTVSAVVYNTPLTGNAGPSGGWNFDYTVPGSFFPSPTSVSGANTIVEFAFTLSDGVLWKVVRLVGPVLAVAVS